MQVFLITYYTDSWYEVEEGKIIVLNEGDIKEQTTKIKVANPKGFLHIFIEKLEVGVESSGIKDPYKEFKRL